MTREDFLKVVPTAFSKMVREAQSILDDEDEARNVAVTVLERWITRGEYQKSKHPGGVVIAMRQAARWKSLDQQRARSGRFSKRSNAFLPGVELWQTADRDNLASNVLTPETIETGDRRAHALEALPRLVLRLPTSDQLIIKRALYEGLSFHVIGQELGVSRFTVGRQYRRALNALKLLLAEEGLI